MTSAGLPPELIKKLLAVPERKRGASKKIDDSVRDYATWFKLRPKSYEDVNMEVALRCDNPNCLDDRPPKVTSTGKEIKVQAVAEIKGQKMCRRCFLGGWLLEDPSQKQLNLRMGDHGNPT